MNPRTALIVAGVALLIGAAGLVVGISAKNGNKSDEDIANATKEQVQQELGTTANQVTSEEQTQATKETDKSDVLQKQVNSLDVQVKKLVANVDSLNSTTATQTNEIKALQDDVNKLDTRVSNLESKP